MDDKDKDIDLPEEIINDGEIDLKEEDSVVSDELLESAEEENEKEHNDEELLENSNDEEESIDETTIDDTSEEEKSDTSETEAGESISPDKTIGQAMDEAEDKGKFYKTDPEVDAAVDDIVRTESDEAIAEADAKVEALNAQKSKVTFGQKIKNGLHAWWENRPMRYGTFTALGILFVAIVLLPTTRYATLNLFGVRVSSSMVVVDSQTRLPLKNINVQLQDKSEKTNEEGEISFTDLKLGNSSLVITKRGYADTNEKIVLGWGSNPIGEQSLLATGEQFTFVLSDWKSGEPITEAEASSGENSAIADESGKIVLTVGEESIANVEIAINAENYRQEILTGESLPSKEKQVKMVPSKKHVFVSTRDGKYDLYSVDVDAENEELILAASGKEREVPIVNPHPTKDIVAFTSSREGETNDEGFIFDGLFIIDSLSGESKRIARSEQLQVIGWSGDRLVYLQIVEGTSAGNDERSKLVSYNYVTGEREDLAASNYFNDVELVGDTLYYAVSSFAIPESQAKLYTIKVDGEDKNKLIDMQVWNIFRSEYDTLLFSAVDQKWFKQAGDSELEEIPLQTSPASINYVNSPNGERTVWVEVRDGKGVLLKSSTKEFSEESVLNMPGLQDVLYWVNDSTVVLRVLSSDETADYVLNIDGGEIQKITDVTATRNTYF